MSLERQEDHSNNPWWGEHIHRYQEAITLIKKDAKVLDIACGSGFGSNLIAKQGHHVIGADLSEEAVNDCNKKYSNTNLQFEVVDGTNMLYSNEVFDVVVSFETIEHSTEYQKMLHEFKRIVKKDGFVIISTPNFLINSPNGVLINPFHTQEWTYEQLKDLLNKTFSSVQLFGQSYTRYRNTKGISFILGKSVERILYCRGVRKLPITIQDKIMNLLIKQPMYPLPENYSLVSEESDIKLCKTFFAICKP
ncbi:MAG: class I SAM-dependent methyltransferase [Bacteroidia bacterium]